VGHSKDPKRPVRNLIAAALRFERETKGLSQEQLAAHLQRLGWDVGRTTITKIELSERCVTDFELVVIADALGITVEKLVGSPARQKVRSLLNTLDR
jgi:transcriptional regulator with XRE-family HTH domain